MYVNMFNKIYFSCQSVAICVLCFAQISTVGSMVQNGSQITGRGGWDCCLLRAFDLTCHCTIYVLIYGPKGTLHHVQVFTLSACLSEHMTILLKSGIIKKQ